MTRKQAAPKAPRPIEDLYSDRRGEEHWTHRHPEWVKRGRARRKTAARGEDHGKAKLSAKNVSYIRQRKHVPARTLAEEFNVQPATIRAIWNRLNWRHVATWPPPAAE